jgi:hypothetical protein
MKKTILLTVLLIVGLAQACTRRESVAGPAKVNQSSATAAPVSLALKMESFKCEIVVYMPPTQMKTSDAALKYRIKITNQSNETWKRQSTGNDPFYKVNIGYHWIDEKSQKSVMEGGRAWFTRDLPPGESEELEMAISPPKDAGAYLLRVEPVQEAVAWFSANHGCKQEDKVTVDP